MNLFDPREPRVESGNVILHPVILVCDVIRCCKGVNFASADLRGYTRIVVEDRLSLLTSTLTYGECR